MYVNHFGKYFEPVLKQSTVQAFCAAISEALKEARLRKKLSMSAVAERAGISQQMVSYVERGIRKPTVDTVFRISVALEVDLGRIIKSATKRMGE
jgi:transcriptional regulator with XRE-family HTH domain